MLYSTVFSTKMKEGVNQTEIATLLTEDGYANTGLTFQWYGLCLFIPPLLSNSVPCEYSSLPGERIGKSRRFTFFRKTVFQNSPFRLGFQNCRARSSRCCGLAYYPSQKTSDLVAMLRDHPWPFAAVRGAFTCIWPNPLSCIGPEKPRGGVAMYMCMCMYVCLQVAK